MPAAGLGHRPALGFGEFGQLAELLVVIGSHAAQGAGTPGVNRVGGAVRGRAEGRSS